MAEQPVLELVDARISYSARNREAVVVPGISFSIATGEAFGLMGESGSGKSTVAAAIVRYLGRSGRLAGGRILFRGRDLAGLAARDMRRLLGRHIAMVFQDPMSSLNPLMTVGRQLCELPRLHFGDDQAAAEAKALRILEQVRLPDPEDILRRYPHQLSGGQQQRVVIAMALINDPALLIMDEPTTGLDPTVENAILGLVNELRSTLRTAILFISHSVHAVAEVCDRVGIMYQGEIVETGSVSETLHSPAHPYTRALLACIPGPDRDRRSNPLQPIRVLREHIPLHGCKFARSCAFMTDACVHAPIPLLEVAGHDSRQARCVRLYAVAQGAPSPEPLRLPSEDRGPEANALVVDRLRKTYAGSAGWFRRSAQDQVVALDDVSLGVPKGRVLAVVGESGSGKSTLARIISGIARADSGTVMLGDIDIARMDVGQRSAAIKKQLQMVFQNPDSTLNPSHTVGYTIGRALTKLRGTARSKLGDEIRQMLATVGLDERYAGLRPDRLSGGQRQRVAIARALAGTPSIVVADEPVSALDLSVQAAIIGLLDEMRRASDMTLIFISHDMPMVRYLSDTVAVLYKGELVEHGPTADVFAAPRHPYTRKLLASADLAAG